MICMISPLSLIVGMSTNNMASNIPARMNSGGSSQMLLAVAITSTGLWVSCIHVRKWPNMEEVVPPSVCPDDLTPEKLLSISSSQTTALPNASMVAVACLIFLSLSPTREPLSAEMSKRIRGQLKIEACCFGGQAFAGSRDSYQEQCLWFGKVFISGFKGLSSGFGGTV